MSRLADSFNQMPRAAKWLLAFGAFLALYFLVLEPSLNAAASARDRADRLEAALRRERSLLASNSQAGRELDRGITTYGLPRHPTSREARPETLQRTVNAILLDHDVENADYSERTGAIPVDQARAVVGSTSKLERFVLDVTFEASPSTAMAILADLESSPDVTAVSKFKMDKAAASRERGSEGGNGRTVRVSIAVESWIAARISDDDSASAGWNPGGLR